MRYLVLSDIHSNLEALDQVLEAARDHFDRVVCLGDLVGYGPDPNAVVAKVRQISSVAPRFSARDFPRSPPTLSPLHTRVSHAPALSGLHSPLPLGTKPLRAATTPERVG